MNESRTALRTDLATAPTARNLAAEDLDQATPSGCASVRADVSSDTLNDKSHRTQWHPAVPGSRVAVPATPASSGGRPC